jgi:PAS domain S-box-containing protein
MAVNKNNILKNESAGLPLLKTLAENSFDSILITDASKEGKVIFANKAFKKLTGYNPAEVIGKTPRILPSQLRAEERRQVRREGDQLQERWYAFHHVLAGSPGQGW